MTEQDVQAMLQYLKALANETRLKIVSLLIDQERNVGELADLLALKEPTISHHLAVLSEAGLVSMRADRNAHFYHLDPATLDRINRELMVPERIANLTRAELEISERKVLATFVDGDVLRKIPDTVKKRMVILKWLAQQFQLDRSYTEAEVNAVIKRHHPDSATLRRELINFKFMHRDHGVYQRFSDEQRLEQLGDLRRSGVRDAID